MAPSVRNGTQPGGAEFELPLGQPGRNHRPNSDHQSHLIKKPYADHLYLIAEQGHDRRFVLVHFGKTADVRVNEEIVVQIVVPGGHLADHALLAFRPELVVNAGLERDAFSGSKPNRFAGDNGPDLAVDFEPAFSGGLIGRAVPDSDRQLPVAGDDVFFLAFVRVRRGLLVAARVHQFLAVLVLFSEIHQYKAVTIEIAETHVGDIPSSIGRKCPAGPLKGGPGIAYSLVDLRTFHVTFQF